MGSTKANRKRLRGAYLIPSSFTMANVFCGYFALMECLRAALLMSRDMNTAAQHFDFAAKAIGFAVLFDGIDGRIARLMGTTSPFGQELDSLADTITFGIAPAFLAFAWGVRAVLPLPDTPLTNHLAAAGWLITFIFVICTAARLARFNIQSSPTVSRADRAEHKQFVGLPTPAAAGVIAAIVHFGDGHPISDWLWVPFWLVLLLAISALMVSTWRYHSFKDLDLRKQHKFAVVIVLGAIGGMIWFWSETVLLLIATCYLLSGICIKASQSFRRSRTKASLPQQKPRPSRSEAL